MQAAHAHFDAEFPRHLRASDMRTIFVGGEANTSKSELANQLTGRSRLASFVDDEAAGDEDAVASSSLESQRQQFSGPTPIGGTASLLSRRPCVLSFLPPVSLAMAAALHGISLASRIADNNSNEGLEQTNNQLRPPSSLSASVLQVVLQKNGFGNNGSISDVKALVPAFIIPTAIIVWKVHAENYATCPESLLHHLAHIVQTAQYVEAACGQKSASDRTLLLVFHGMDANKKQSVEDYVLTNPLPGNMRHGMLLTQLRGFFSTIQLCMVPPIRQRADYHASERRVLEECYQLAAKSSPQPPSTSSRKGETSFASNASVEHTLVNAVSLGRIFAALALQASQPQFYSSFPLTTSSSSGGGSSPMVSSSKHLDASRTKYFKTSFVSDDALAFLSFTLQRNFSTQQEWKNAGPDQVRVLCRQVLEEVRVSFFGTGGGDAAEAGKLFASNAADTIEAIISEAQQKARTALIEKMAENVRSRAEALSVVLREILKTRETTAAAAAA